MAEDTRHLDKLIGDAFRMHAIIEASPFPLFTTDLAGVVEDANPAAEALTGQSRDQILGTSFEQWFTEHERARDLVRLTLSEHRLTGYELAFAGHGGAVPVRCDAATFLDAEHKPRGIVATLHDLSEERKLRNDLINAIGFGTAIIEAAADGLIAVDRGGTILDVNDQFCQISGYARSELLGSGFAGYFTDARRARDAVDETWAGDSFRDYHLALTTGGGDLRKVSLSTWIFSAPTGTDRRFVALVRDITKEAAAQEQMARERAYNRGLLDASVDGMATVNFRGCVSDVNARMCLMLGLPREQIVGMEFTHCFTDPGAAAEAVNHALVGGQALNYELRLANDEQTIVSVNAAIYRGEGGEVAGVVASARDISQQSRLQADISAQRAYNRALIESSAEAFFAITPDGLIADANALASALTGYSRRHLLGRPFCELFDDPDTARRWVADAFDHGQAADHELTISGGGRQKVVSFNAGVFRDGAGGAPQGLLAAARDITAQKELQNALRAQELYARSLIEANVDAMLITDVSGEITDINKPMEALAGRSRRELVGSHISGCFTDPGRAKDMVSGVLRDGRLTDFELTARRPDGTTTVVSCNTATFAGSDGKLRGVFAAVRDITAQKKLEEMQRSMLAEARRLDEVKSDFVSRVSHELRSPLTGILGYLELLKAGRAGKLSEEQKRVIAIVQRGGKRLQALIEDLLLLSRIEANALSMTIGRVTLGPLIQGVYESFLPALRERQIEARLDLDPAIVLDADAQQLERVAANLISNAIKFTPEGGHIGINTRRDDGDVVFQVRDTGIGVPENEQSLLFSRFFRSSISSEVQATGTGLGLFIVKQIAEGHGGTATAESRLGVGSTFTVRLPATQQAAPQPAAEAEAAVAPPDALINGDDNDRPRPRRRRPSQTTEVVT